MIEIELYSSPSIIRMIKFKEDEIGRACSTHGEEEEEEEEKKKNNAYRILIRKPEGKRPLRRTVRRWEDDIKMDLRKTG
jgi:hypothetical protein